MGTYLKSAHITFNLAKGVKSNFCSDARGRWRGSSRASGCGALRTPCFQQHENAPIQILKRTGKAAAYGLARLVLSPGVCEFSNSHTAPLPRLSQAAPLSD